jgi:hypothetical protein
LRGSASLLTNLVDFNQDLTCRQKIPDPGPTSDHEILEGTVAAIPAGNPYNSRWWPEAFLQVYEVAVLGDDYGAGLASPLEISASSAVSRSRS